MDRREISNALAAATVAGLLLVLAMGSMTVLGERAVAHPPHDDPAPAAAPATRVPVICYHYVHDPGGPLHFARVFGYVVLSLPLLDDTQLWRVSARNFEHQMEYLKSRGYHTVTLDDLHEWQLGWRNLPPKPVVLTFDDGEVSAYDEAFPVLQRLGLHGTLFVVTSRVGTHWDGIQCLDWERLRSLQRSGVFDIESHTDDMHYKVTVDGVTMPVFVAASQDGYALAEGANWRDQVLADLARSRDAIARHVGHVPHYLAWPYGFGNPDVDSLAAEAGFTRTFALRARAVRQLAADARLRVDDTDRFEIPRYTVTARTSLRDFRAMLDGTYQASR